MATGKLFGADTGDTILGYAAPDYICVSKWVSDYTGKVTEIRIRAAKSGNVKVGLYDDSENNPHNLLLATGSTAVTAGWNTISVTPTNVTQGTSYWTAYDTDTSNCVGLKADIGRRHQYKSLAFSSSFPNPAGSGWIVTDGYREINAAWGILVLSPSSISQPVTHGTPKLSLILKPSGIVQAVASGTPAVVTSSLVIYPPGIAQAVGVGTPCLRYPQVVSPPGIDQLVVVGQPWVGIFGFVKPAGTVQQISIGSPSLYRYVWHVVLDGSYAMETPGVNRIYIIGRDAVGNPVYGMSQDAAEMALVGERLDFRQEPAVNGADRAAEVAGSILARMRLSKASGVIVIPPNCGQELWDVVQVWDSAANQTAAKFRVVGIRFEYSPGQARYEHRLILGNP